MKIRLYTILFAITAVLCVVALAACGGLDKQTDDTPDFSESETEAVTEPPQETFEISFVVDGEVKDTKNATLDDLSKVVPDEKAGYEFEGWYVDKDTWQTPLNEASIENGVQVYAKFTPAVYSITYDIDNKAVNPNHDSYTVESGRVILSTPRLAGYTFEGWYEGDTRITEIPAGSTGNRTIRAAFEPITYDISYFLTNNNAVAAQNPTSYNIESEDLILAAPTLAGYSFEGWYNGDERVTEISKGSMGSIVLQAKWKLLEYTITYNNVGNNVTNSNPKVYTTESDRITLASLTKSGYSFDGWYSGNTKVTEIPAGSVGNYSLTARWTPIVYTVTYSLDKNSTHSNPTQYSVESGALTLTSPTSLNGHSFEGWYIGEEKVTQIPAGSVGNLTIKAKWSGSYTVSFQPGTGSGEMASQTYTYGGKANLPLNTFQKADYIFVGWKDDDGNTYRNAQDFFKQPSDGTEFTLTAQWRSALGFDISNYQAEMSFDTYVNANAGFLILRAGNTGWGTGVSYNKDASFEKFYAEAKARGIPVGAYWYSCANTYEKGWNEAKFMYENCLQGKTFEFPIFMDVENSQWQGAGDDEYPGGTKDGVTAAIKGFCDYMASKNMYTVVYTYLSFCSYFDMDEIAASYDIWLAAYIEQSSVEERYNYGKYDMWQWSDSYSGLNLDANWVYKDYETFIKRFGFNGFEAEPDAEYKTYIQLAEEVLAGKWGSGEARKINLIAAGYDYSGVQDAVNWLLS